MVELTRYGVELRAEVRGSTMVGHAAVFDQVADIGPHWERIAPGAFDAALAAPGTDVRALVNHDPTLLLGRQSSGTLRLWVDDEGLAFEVDLPDTQAARDLRALAARGDITGASFGFVPGADVWEKAPDGRRVRSHTSVGHLVDVSPVTWPAYDGATAALRSVGWTVGSNRDRRTRQLRARARLHRRRMTR